MLGSPPASDPALRPPGWSLPIALWSFAAACAAMFFVPWYFPRTEPVLGESYALGFNNRLAVVGLCAVIIAAAVARIRAPGATDESRETLAWFADDGWAAARHASRLQYVLLGGFCLLMTQFILWWDRMLVIPYWGEADYFLSRIDLVALGHRPYDDFHYLYGPLQLYAPLWLDRALSGAPGIETAYASTVAVQTVLGACCLFVFLQALAIPAWSRSWVLLVSLVMWLPITMGLQYTPLRFTAVPCAIAMLHVAYARATSAAAGRARLACAAAAGLAATLMLSPEMGIVFAVAVVAFAGVLVLRKDWAGAAAAVAAAGAVAAAVRYAFPHYLRSIDAFAAGAMNFPLYPNLHNVLLAGVATFVISRLAAAAFGAPGAAKAPLAAAVGAASAVLLAPSLGRCDPGHVMTNSLMLWLLMVPASVAFGRGFERAVLAVFAVAFVLLSQVSYWGHYGPNFKQALAVREFYRQNPATVWSWRQAWEKRKAGDAASSRLNWKRTAPFPEWAEQQPVLSADVALPLGIDLALDRYVKLQPGFRPPQHPGPKPDIHGPRDVERAVAEVTRLPVAILPEWAVAVAKASRSEGRAAYEKSSSRFLSRLLLFPVSCVTVHDPFMPEVELCRRVLARGDIMATVSGAVIVKARPDPADPPPAE